MYPTLDNSDVLLLLKTKNVDYGDIIVVENDGALLVKRVIAKSGDTVSVNGSKVSVNNSVIKEAYAYYDDSMNSLSDVSCELPENSVFVMGDNRKESYDSRKIGPIGNDLIVGKVFFNVTALTGLHEEQFRLSLRIISIVCIILLTISVMRRKSTKSVPAMQSMRCNEYVSIGGDIDVHISDVSEYSRQSEGVRAESGGDAVRYKGDSTE